MKDTRIIANLLVSIIIINTIWGMIFELLFLMAITYTYMLGVVLGGWLEEEDASCEESE